MMFRLFNLYLYIYIYIYISFTLEYEENKRPIQIHPLNKTKIAMFGVKYKTNERK